MFKSIVNAVINSNSTTIKVVGYTAIAAVGIGADIIGASAKKENKVAPATEKVHDEDTVMEVVHDEDTVMEVVHDEVEFEDELFEAAIKSTSNSFEAACEEAIELKENGNEEEAIETEKMAKLFLDYLQLSLGKEDECLVVHNAKEALAAFRTFGPKRIEWM